MRRQQRPEEEPVSDQFNRLIRDVINGTLKRSSFQRWEIELLLDISQCGLRERKREATLRSYQTDVRRELLNGASVPPRLSEYLGRNGHKG